MLLAFDTSTAAGSVALWDQRLLALRTFDAGREHSKRLFPEIEQVLVDAGRSREQVVAVGVTIGPGSFTGLRIGLSAAKGLCRGLEVPLVAVSTLEVLAARLPWCRLPVCAVLDARRGEVYTATYDTSQGRPVPMGPERALTPEALLAEWGDGDVLFTGDGVDRLPEEVRHRAPSSLARPCAAEVAWLAEPKLAGGDTADPMLLEPVYLRTPSFVKRQDQAVAS